MSTHPALWRLMSMVQLEALHRDGANWKCRCPAHQDRTASLGIKIGEDGRLLIHCYAGCQTESVLQRWGVSWEALFPDQPQPNGPLPEARQTGSEEPEQTYDYLDEEGRLLFQVCRFANKEFRQRRPLSNGKWAWNLRHVRRVLYHLPELAKADPETWVFLVEGEKDADRLLQEGLLATTSPMGAGKWKDEYAQALIGRKVIIIPDNDEAGREHAQQVAASLAPVAAQVAVLQFSQFPQFSKLPEKGDISDWLDQPGHSVQELLGLAKNSVPVPTYIGRTENRNEWAFVTVGELLAEEDVEPPDIVAGGLMPSGGVSILGSKPKVGKSTLVRCLALAVAQGREFLGRQVKQGPVIYLALEEKRSEVRKHFQLLGARDEDPIHIHVGAAPPDALKTLLVSVREVRPILVIIDTVFRFIRVKDVAAYAEIVSVLSPVLDAARAYGCHFLLCHHNTKVDQEDADSLLGSVGIQGSVDTTIILRRKADGTRFAFSRQRYGSDMEPTVMVLNSEKQVVAANDLESYEVEKTAERVLEFLKTEPEPVAELELRERLEVQKQRLVRALHALYEAGSISRWGSGRKGDPYKFSIPWHRQGEAMEQQEPRE